MCQSLMEPGLSPASVLSTVGEPADHGRTARLAGQLQHGLLSPGRPGGGGHRAGRQAVAGIQPQLNRVNSPADSKTTDATALPHGPAAPLALHDRRSQGPHQAQRRFSPGGAAGGAAVPPLASLGDRGHRRLVALENTAPLMARRDLDEQIDLATAR
jgi:hypothetical protein